MKKLFLITSILLIFTNLVFAQTVTVPVSVAESALTQAKATIDQDESDLKDLNMQLDNNNKALLSIQGQISNIQTQISAKQAEILQNQQNISAIAAPPYSLQPAIDLINSNPIYGTLSPSSLAVSGAACSQNSDCQSGVCNGPQGVNWTVGTCQ